MNTNTSNSNTDNEVEVKDKDVAYLLTTTDNPFNPHKQWDDWFAFDTQAGYNTCAYLARIVKSSDELSEADEALAIQAGMDEILRLNITGRYIKVTEESFEKRKKELESNG